MMENNTFAQYNLTEETMTLDSLRHFINTFDIQKMDAKELRDIFINFMRSIFIKDKTIIREDAILTRFYNIMKPHFNTIMEQLFTIPIGYDTFNNITEDRRRIRQFMEFFNIWGDTSTNYIDIAYRNRSYALLTTEFSRLNASPEIITKYIAKMITERQYLFFSYFFLDKEYNYREYITPEQVRVFYNTTINDMTLFTIPSNINQYNLPILAALIRISTIYYPKMANENNGISITRIFNIFTIWRDTQLTDMPKTNWRSLPHPVIYLMPELVKSISNIQMNFV